MRLAVPHALSAQPGRNVKMCTWPRWLVNLESFRIGLPKQHVDLVRKGSIKQATALLNAKPVHVECVARPAMRAQSTAPSGTFRLRATERPAICARVENTRYLMASPNASHALGGHLVKLRTKHPCLALPGNFNPAQAVPHALNAQQAASKTSHSKSNAKCVPWDIVVRKPMPLQSRARLDFSKTSSTRLCVSNVSRACTQLRPLSRSAEPASQRIGARVGMPTRRPVTPGSTKMTVNKLLASAANLDDIRMNAISPSAGCVETGISVHTQPRHQFDARRALSKMHKRQRPA